MTANCLILSGVICKTPIYKISPSGISHCKFILEHYSVQQEVGFSRQAWCRLPVVISRKQTINITQNISVGVHVTVQGFINCHQARNGLSKIVLHAEQINFIDFGD